MLEPDAYCRAIEAHLCRKNDGHLIRIVGPAFERVSAWAEQGVPVKVAMAGIDRYFERYYRKGPRRRPVRVEFCDADVLDAFDEWRRAVGVSLVAHDAAGGPLVEDPLPATSRGRHSLRAQLETALARFAALRGGGTLDERADTALARAEDAIAPIAGAADHARGDQRHALIERLSVADRELIAGLEAALPEATRADLAGEAARQLEPFRARMTLESHAHAQRNAVARLVREHFGVPELAP